MMFLLVVVLVGVRLGRGPAVLASFVSVAVFDFFFVPPRFSFAVSDVQYLLTFAVMLAVALVIGNLTAGLRYQAKVASTREDRSRAVSEFARELSGLLETERRSSRSPLGSSSATSSRVLRSWCLATTTVSTPMRCPLRWPVLTLAPRNGCSTTRSRRDWGSATVARKVDSPRAAQPGQARDRQAYDWPSTCGNAGNTSFADDADLKPPLRVAGPPGASVAAFLRRAPPQATTSSA